MKMLLINIETGRTALPCTVNVKNLLNLKKQISDYGDNHKDQASKWKIQVEGIMLPESINLSTMEEARHAIKYIKTNLAYGEVL